MVIAVLSAIAFTIVLVQGFSYWSRPDEMSWQDCAYGNAACSTAAGTWILAFITLAAFLAAFQAVYWAWKTFSIEVEPRLGESRCQLSRQSGHPVDKEVFLDENGRVSYRRPVEFDPDKSIVDEYFEYHHAFRNLGRTALADVKVDLYLVDAEAESRSQAIPVAVGNVTCDGEIHVAIYTSQTFQKLSIEWQNATQARATGVPQRESIRLFAEDTSSDGQVFPIDPDLSPPVPSPSPSKQQAPPTVSGGHDNDTSASLDDICHPRDD